MNRDITGTDRDAISGDLVLPLVEEEARIEKRLVSTGKVRIRTHVETVEENVQGDLETEEVEVTRVPVDRVVTEAPQVRTEGEVTIVPVLEEVLFVEKRLVLKEELHIRRHVTTETVDVPVTLRRERASVEREGGDGNITEEKSYEL